MRHTLLLLPFCLAFVAFGDDKKAEPKFTPEQLAFYDKQAKPLLQQHCYKCHAAKKRSGGLKLDSRSAVLKGGDTGSAVDLQKPDESLMIKALHHKDGLEMPPSGKLAQKDIDTLTKWVKMGVPFLPGTDTAEEPGHKEMKITDADRNWWAYRPLKRPPVPVVKNTIWPANAIDHFILAQLEAKDLTPVAPADRVALLRRVSYDLTGLAPTPDEVDAFVKDTSPDAYERVIDRLLSSPAYGEKWGRHWLDLVRFAETNGYERDGPKPYAWRFRDYVIRAFNDDKPYDRFVREQLAGDEMGDIDGIIATGYYRLGLWDDEPPDPKQARADEIDDWVSTTGQVFLGSTFNCARCHDHKKDPIPQKDYYQLAAFFEDVGRYSNSRDPRSMTNLTEISTPNEDTRRRDTRKVELEKQMQVIEEVGIKKMSDKDQRAAEGSERPQVLRKLRDYLPPDQMAQYAALRKERDALVKQPVRGQELALSVNNCIVRPPTTHLFIRGNPHAAGAKVEPGFPTVLNVPAPKIPEPAKGARTSGRRSVLADWVVSKDNPLTARVIVNRVWHFHFGRGLCPTPSDFGKLGEPPSHPELIDWLATEFVDSGWSMKRLHRLILKSSTYRLSSKGSEAGLKKDPANTSYWRFNARRLTAEEVRDSILTVSGELSRRMAGPGVYPRIPKEVLAGQSKPGDGWGNSPTIEASRRSVYVHIKRSLIVPILQNHDQADTDSSCPVRYTTTVPTQALGMLNGDFTNEQARLFAERLRTESDTLDEQVRRAIRLTTGRAPTPDEVKRDMAFVQELAAEGNLTNDKALAAYCLLAINANEFIYLD